jgi:Na+/H+-dicarboxylate symporter
LLSLLPDNITRDVADGQLLGLIVFALFFGAVLSTIGRRSRSVTEFFQTVHEVTLKLVNLLLWAAPIGLLCLVGSVVARDSGALVEGADNIVFYIMTLIIGLAIHAAVILPLAAKIYGKRSPLEFLNGSTAALTTAFGTASSTATLPMTYRSTVDDNKVDQRASAFVLPLGSTLNMNGTAMFIVIAALFVAQAAGIKLGIGQILLVGLTGMLVSFGTAGVPGAGLIGLMSVLALFDINTATVGLALIVGVDWLADRLRTVVNVWGDAIGAAVISETEDFQSRRRDTRRDREDRGGRDQRRDPRKQRSSRDDRRSSRGDRGDRRQPRGGRDDRRQRDDRQRDNRQRDNSRSRGGRGDRRSSSPFDISAESTPVIDATATADSPSAQSQPERSNRPDRSDRSERRNDGGRRSSSRRDRPQRDSNRPARSDRPERKRESRPEPRSQETPDEKPKSEFRLDSPPPLPVMPEPKKQEQEDTPEPERAPSASETQPEQEPEVKAEPSRTSEDDSQHDQQPEPQPEQVEAEPEGQKREAEDSKPEDTSTDDDDESQDEPSFGRRVKRSRIAVTAHGDESEEKEPEPNRPNLDKDPSFSEEPPSYGRTKRKKPGR